ncbi:UDP-N-acetylglucosamine--LPS N-acetylglucosamine transferase [Patescibacteria group bacterium]|nr:UDP-N-acetylglucosamine--LPS N-acetylglucosamine transferase [Patescibacteria group bacterium]MBU1967396.1 UDP-N-acetylglucosamine--LPS N-acetylglucosamine transferase [Patescibacteria group bacterium]MBU2543424.1 UDP-N-acetylglucosamine--LPS N-acetylglucosamine transferase [Patescibacteria group bacterium]
MKIGLVTSAGGHLFQLLQLKSCWENRVHFWVSFDKSDTISLLEGENLYLAYYPESRNILNFFYNLWLAFKILLKEKPQVLISAGAGIAPPFFIVGKLFGMTLVFIEPLDFIDKPSLSGRLVYLLADLFLIQNVQQQRFFPKAKYWGSTL